MTEHLVDYCWMDTEFQWCKMRRVTELDGGDGCTTAWMYLILLNYTPEND